MLTLLMLKEAFRASSTDEEQYEEDNFQFFIIFCLLACSNPQAGSDTKQTGENCDECGENHVPNSQKCPECGEHGSCADGATGSGLCECDEGWAGTICDYELKEIGLACDADTECQSGLICDEYTQKCQKACKSVDDCKEGQSCQDDGYCSNCPEGFYFGSSGRWWSYTEYSNSLAYFLYLGDGNAGVGYYDNKTYGISVRCLKDEG